MSRVRRRPTRRLVEAVGLVALAGLLVVLAVAPVLSSGPGEAPATEGGPRASAVPHGSGGQPPLGPMRGPLHESGLLVLADGPVSAPRVAAVSRRPGVAEVHRLGVASLVLAGRSVNVAATDPASYRAFTDRRTARSLPVWQAVARGELAVTHSLATDLGLTLGGTVPLGGGTGTLRLGAVATTVPGIDAVVAPTLGQRLGVPLDNALLVALAPGADVAATTRGLGQVLDGAAVHPLRPAATAGGEFSARLVGGSVADAVGSFGYRWFADGSVQPDPAWVGAQIVTAEVPILGRVTCHRVMVPQLRGALQAVVDAGLADAVDASDYGGCYVPRFIDRDPRRGLSLHTWGIAVDLNVASNQLGTSGTIDRRVVELFRQWGFAWGGTWRRPDPMHFELAALVAPG